MGKPVTCDIGRGILVAVIKFISCFIHQPCDGVGIVRIAVLGAAGQLGRDLMAVLNLHEAIALSREQIDLSRPDSISSTIAALNADVLINCAAYNFVDKAETDESTAFSVNAYGVRHLAKACLTVGTKLVHISTDFVFGLDQMQTTPLTETALPGPVSVYGSSKLAGEQFVLAESVQNLVIRTCGLYGIWGSGGKGGNFVETMLRVAGQGKPLRVVHDQRCTPSYTADVAKAILEAIQVNATGLLHITNSGCTTWYEFAAAIFKRALIQADLTAISTAEFAAPARRPVYSVLSGDRLVSLGISRPRPWSEALASYLIERKRIKT
jgi:dTDP-4-dehydrorhamnose reductase